MRLLERDGLITTTELAAFLSLPVRTLRQWRYLGVGPRRSEWDGTCVTSRPRSGAGWTTIAAVRNGALDVASIDRRPNGRWRARWRDYPGGPQKAKHFTRKIDAERFLVDVQHRLMAGTYITPEASRVTFGEFAEVYLSRLPWRFATADKALEALTRARAKWDRRPLGSIRKGDVQALVSGLALAPTTVRVVHQHLVSLFGAAVDDRPIATNPARGVKLPERSRGEIVPPTREQVEAIGAELPAWFRISAVLGAGLGLRQAETAGLTIDRIDWLGRTVLIGRQWVTRRGRCEFGPPKTATSHRTIPAAPWVLEQLSEHVGRCHSGFVLHRGGPRCATVCSPTTGTRGGLRPSSQVSTITTCVMRSLRP